MIPDKDAMMTHDGMTGGWSLIMSWGAMIALFPIEEWLEALERAETTGPILDPTLFRDYLYSGKGPIIKDVLRGALEFKRAILKAQKDTIEPEGKKHGNARSNGPSDQFPGSQTG